MRRSRGAAGLGDAWLRNLETLLNEGQYRPLRLLHQRRRAIRASQRYAEVTDFLDLVLEEIDLKPDRPVVVPGNHDIDRHAQGVWKSCACAWRYTTCWASPAG